MSGTIIQFKLISGEEIACEVVDFPSEEDPDFIIKNALILLRNGNNPTEAQYLFKPWIAMIESDNDYISLASDKVMALCEPTTAFSKEYRIAKSQLHNISKMRQSYYDKMDNDYIRQLMEELDNVFDGYEDESNSLIEQLQSRTPVNNDSDGTSPKKGKVLQFPKREDDDTVH